MVRIVKDHAVRLSEILAVSQKLIYTKGYEQMTIQDILDELQISKGAFYHYFDSKQSLLEALIEHMMQDSEQFILPIIEDPQSSALEKFQRFFDQIARWKIARKTFLLALMRAWYSDDNAIVRQKITIASLKRFTPMLTSIICQGVQEGVLQTPYPEQVGEVVLSMIVSMGESFADAFLPNGLDQAALESVESTISVYTDALERVLGAPKGSISLIDDASLREWFVSPADNPPSQADESQIALHNSPNPALQDS